MTYREQIGFCDYKLDVRAKLCEYDLSKEEGIGYTAAGDIFYFDIEDYEIIKDFPWYMANTGYMCAHVRINGKRPFILMHRLIMNAPKGLIVDHIGGIETKNDNRRCNLRLATVSQNTINRAVTNKTGVTGVRYTPWGWRCYINVDKKHLELGTYKDFDDAVKVRREAEDKYYGDFSYTKSQEIRQLNAII